MYSVSRISKLSSCRGMRRLCYLRRLSGLIRKQKKTRSPTLLPTKLQTKRTGPLFRGPSVVAINAEECKAALSSADVISEPPKEWLPKTPHSSGDSREDRIAAREVVKRTLPRYARINTLIPGMSWGHVQRELQKSGFVLWRPSVREKRAAKNPAIGPEPPQGVGGKLYYRDAHIQDMLIFCPMGQSRTAHVDMFESGGLIFQQKASAFPALALAPPRGSKVIDSCAAPGSKTSQMAALMQNEGTIVAFDRDQRRLRTLADLMRHQGVTCVEPCHQDFLEASPQTPNFADVTHFLLDPSCSSSGTMTTQPESEHETMSKLVNNQSAIIRHAMRFPSCQRIAYSTCSVYTEENEDVVQTVLRSPEGAQFKLVEALPWWPRRGLPVFPDAHFCVRTSWEDKTIGFFIALFERKD
eukprot:gnl/MRDRNA2_/MRDRNA2_20131_c0_seq1.p1 gnl/MRDRNA2_/MRDRNA2_20131_c0~~gnl/MRDRNA2_/MRDRNA2_20131_c0_seq1.p1  ORF type:complete len:412 (+),score=60.78 gnl/MRDRNA2_/MRDRNA2_20131_c0_seq1:239-1474(+)